MQHPKTRKAASREGRFNRNTEAVKNTGSEAYVHTDSVSSVSVYMGRLYLGSIHEMPDGHKAIDATGAVLGEFLTRVAAARAFSGAC
jgi:hypothetical protein